MHEDALHNNIKHQCYLHVNETDPEGDRHDELPGSEEPNDLDRLNEAGTVKISLHVLGNSITSELSGNGIGIKNVPLEEGVLDGEIDGEIPIDILVTHD